jgi:hypothetical protein
MSYWWREVAGWVLVLLGLFAFWRAYDLLLGKRVFEAGPLVVVGIIVFRGGIHLLKVAVAAQAARAMPEPTKQTTRRHVGVDRPYAPTDVKKVKPGPKPKAVASAAKPWEA